MEGCSGWCLPIYVYITITLLNIVANLVWGAKGLGSRMWGAARSTMWSILYGIIVFLLCNTCQYPAAYLALIPASVWFGFQMFLLLLRRPQTTVVENKT